ncbi:AAA family ATPase [Nonomuraea sp. NPDC046802]|uniref:AAA family ATPase n=1 Tax=Nonomuraea sp. NPDC046802 TaxID=3154919 RepID=UPI0033E4EAA3
MGDSIHQSAPPFVARLGVRDYKSIGSCEVDFGPLTILVGLNAAGKSNLLDAIKFVRDALVDSPRRALAKRGGLRSVLRRFPEGGSAGSFAIVLELALADGDTARYEIEVGADPEGEFSHLVAKERCELNVSGKVHGFTADFTGERRREVHGGITGAILSPEELLLPVVGRLSPFVGLLRTMVGPRFYELDTDVLRELDESSAGQRLLGERGEHLGQVLTQLQADHPSFKQSMDEYLRAIVPLSLGVDPRYQGDYTTISARFWTGDPHLPYWDAINAGAVNAGDPHVRVFEREQLSEGTVRAVGVLAALHQPGTLTGDIRLVALEEPEIAIHPSNVVALFSAMREASSRTQIIATTQSSDLLSAEDISPDDLRIVEMRNSATVIGGLDDHTRSYLAERPSELSELHRQGYLSPMVPPDEVCQA